MKKWKLYNKSQAHDYGSKIKTESCITKKLFVIFNSAPYCSAECWTPQYYLSVNRYRGFAPQPCCMAGAMKMFCIRKKYISIGKSSCQATHDCCRAKPLFISYVSDRVLLGSAIRFADRSFLCVCEVVGIFFWGGGWWRSSMRKNDFRGRASRKSKGKRGVTWNILVKR